MSGITSRKHAATSNGLSAWLAPSAACLLALGVPAAVTAQTGAAAVESAQAKPDSALPEVKVKAERDNPLKPDAVASPKFVKPLLDTPQTVIVIDKALIQQRGTTSLSEALASTPGITFTLGENGVTFSGDTPTMRGFDTQFSIFVDGIRDLGGIVRDTFNTEQVEVVKGPSGSDNGRGAASGYINLVSKLPQARDFSDGELKLGTDSRARLSADLNRKLDLGPLPGAAMRLNAFTDRGDAPGRDVVKFKRSGVAPSLTLGLGGSTRATLSLLHVEQDDIPDGGIPVIGLAGYDSVNIYASETSFASPTPVSGVSPVNSANYYGSLGDFDRVKADMITLRLESDLGPGMRVSNTSRFGRAEQRTLSTNLIVVPTATAASRFLIVGDPARPETWTGARFRFARDQRNQILTNQTNLSAGFHTGSVRHNVSTGLEFIYEQQDGLGFSFGTGPADLSRANLYSPSTADLFVVPTANGSSVKGSTLTAAVYLFDTLDLSDSWQLLTGLRFERYRTEFTSVPPTPVPPATLLATTNLAKADDLVTGKLGVVYKPVPQGSLYALYAVSQKPPGTDTFTLNPGQSSGTTSAININGTNVSPQEASNLEFGVKWEVFERRVLLTGALFDTANKNELARGDPTTGEVIQFGKRSVRGVELSAAGAITRALQVQAGLAYLRARIDEGVFVIGGTPDSQAGANLRFTPKLSFSSWLSYKLPFGLTLAGGARYLASQATAENNGATPVTGATRVPSYWVYDAMAAFEVNKSISVQLNVNNLADEFYLASVNSGRNRYTLGTPRTATLAASFRF